MTSDWFWSVIENARQDPAVLPESVEDFPPSSVHDGITLDIYHRRFGTCPPDRDD